MPVLIVVPQSTIPAVIEQETDAGLLAFIATHKEAPEAASQSIESAREWRARMPRPSGIFLPTRQAAPAKVRQTP